MPDVNYLVHLGIYAAGLLALSILLKRDMKAFEQINREKFDFWLFFAQFYQFRFKLDKTDKYQMAAKNYILGAMPIGFLMFIAFSLSNHFLR
ncbi:MAG: hypothetical protein GY789_20680 [Hyphomicrobiales bacterium]|nr:hypothetical protein [Hyphomicrobiales bacterium]